MHPSYVDVLKAAVVILVIAIFALCLPACDPESLLRVAS